MKIEYWRRWTTSTWHICVDDPHDNYLSYEPDIYSMRSLCDRHEFQRDKSRYIPWTREGTPARVCKACISAAEVANNSALHGRNSPEATTPQSNEAPE